MKYAMFCVKKFFVLLPDILMFFFFLFAFFFLSSIDSMQSARCIYWSRNRLDPAQEYGAQLSGSSKWYDEIEAARWNIGWYMLSRTYCLYWINKAIEYWIALNCRWNQIAIQHFFALVATDWTGRIAITISVKSFQIETYGICNLAPIIQYGWQWCVIESAHWFAK